MIFNKRMEALKKGQHQANGSHTNLINLKTMVLARTAPQANTTNPKSMISIETRTAGTTAATKFNTGKFPHKVN